MNSFKHHLEICTSIGCSINCSYCPQKLTTKNFKKISANKFMSFEIFETCIAKLPTNSHIVFSGYVEPFLNPLTINMVSLANDLGHIVSVFTTLIGIQEHMVKDLAKIPFFQFRVHLPDNQNRMNLEVDRTYINVLNTIISKKIDNVKYIIYGEKKHPEIILPMDNDIIFREPYSRASNLSGFELLRHKGPIKCSFNHIYKNILIPNGDVALCCNDFGLKHIIGNLLNQEYSSLHSSNEFQKIMTGLVDDKSDILCRTCELAVPLDIAIDDIKDYNKHLSYYDFRRIK